MSIRAATENSEQKEYESEESFQKLVSSHEQLNSSYKKLLNDHEELQKIYLQIEADYEDMYADLGKKHAQIGRLNAELDEMKEKYQANLACLNRVEAKLSAYTSRLYVECGVNTVESEAGVACGRYKSREELERFYECKFSELNSEINLLKDKVMLFTCQTHTH